MLDFIGVLMFLIPVLIIAVLGGIGYFFWVRFRYRTARSSLRILAFASPSISALRASASALRVVS
ncbi:MAG: hypothetical protein ACQEWV_16155 [Bacillota bacterium]